jgi:hypothetical protein
MEIVSGISIQRGTIMNESEFWQVIQQIDHTALQECDDDGAVAPLIKHLSRVSESEIRDFENILAQTLYEIDSQMYAYHAGDSEKSGDGFLYARCFVVAKGQEFYHHVKTNPTNMPDSTDDWCESLLYVAQRAWAEATGNDEEDWDHDTPLSYETGSNENLWE